MKTSLLLLPFALMFAACDGGTDTDTDPDSDSDTDMGTEFNDSDLVGDWLSEGENVSGVFRDATFDYVSIDASFESNGTYEVTALDGSGSTFVLSGSYTVDTSTDPASIVLSQTSPTTLTAEGIWAVDGTTLTYEVVQTTPDFGFVPPTPATGFGSTSGNGLLADVNIQVYVAQ